MEELKIHLFTNNSLPEIKNDPIRSLSDSEILSILLLLGRDHKQADSMTKSLLQRYETINSKPFNCSTLKPDLEFDQLLCDRFFSETERLTRDEANRLIPFLNILSGIGIRLANPIEFINNFIDYNFINLHVDPGYKVPQAINIYEEHCEKIRLCMIVICINCAFPRLKEQQQGITDTIKKQLIRLACRFNFGKLIHGLWDNELMALDDQDLYEILTEEDITPTQTSLSPDTVTFSIGSTERPKSTLVNTTYRTPRIRSLASLCASSLERSFMTPHTRFETPILTRSPLKQEDTVDVVRTLVFDSNLPLHIACSKCNLGDTRNLLKKASPNVLDETNHTALYYLLDSDLNIDYLELYFLLVVQNQATLYQGEFESLCYDNKLNSLMSLCWHQNIRATIPRIIEPAISQSDIREIYPDFLAFFDRLESSVDENVIQKSLIDTKLLCLQQYFTEESPIREINMALLIHKHTKAQLCTKQFDKAYDLSQHCIFELFNTINLGDLFSPIIQLFTKLNSEKFAHKTQINIQACFIHCAAQCYNSDPQLVDTLLLFKNEFPKRSAARRQVKSTLDTLKPLIDSNQHDKHSKTEMGS